MFIPNLVVFSHLRWSFVHQRSRHLLGRLAGRWQITFIEEPAHTAAQAFIEVLEVEEHLTVLVPHTPLKAPGFHDEQFGVLYPMIDDWMSEHGIEQTILWLTTPMALPLAQALHPLCLVYDCRDEPDAFRTAPPPLWEHERALMKQAALVVFEGPAMDESRRRLNPHVLCVPGPLEAPDCPADRLDPVFDACREERGSGLAARVVAGSWDRSADTIDALLWEAREAALGARMTDHRGLIPRAQQHVGLAPDRR